MDQMETVNSRILLLRTLEHTERSPTSRTTERTSKSARTVTLARTAPETLASVGALTVGGGFCDIYVLCRQSTPKDSVFGVQHKGDAIT